jgi:hypothetical protein
MKSKQEKSKEELFILKYKEKGWLDFTTYEIAVLGEKG